MQITRGLATAFVLAASALPCGTALAHSDHRTFAAGAPGDSSKPARIVAVTLAERPDGAMIITPATLDVARGEQIRFEVRNAGKAAHEFMLDSMAHNASHKLAMRENPGMVHDDPNGRTLDPGASTAMLWRFTKTGRFEYACLLPGHYEAGMHGIVTVRK